MPKSPNSIPSEPSGPLSNSIPKELEMEINSDASIEECLTLARLYLKRAKELSHSRKGIYGGL